jgi:hypothetical protein
MQRSILDIVRDPAAVNHRAAREYIIVQSDRLRLLAIVLGHLAAPCAANMHDGTHAPLGDDGDAELPLLTVAVCRPRALYAYVEALLQRMPEQMPGADPVVFAELRLWNALLWRCPHAPPACAVLAFWTLATAHTGIFDLVLAAEPARSWWRFDAQFDRLRAFISALVTNVLSVDVCVALANARRLQLAIAHAVVFRDDRLLAADTAPRRQRLTTATKEHMVARVLRTIREAPSTHADATMANSSLPPSAGSIVMKM